MLPQEWDVSDGCEHQTGQPSLQCTRNKTLQPGPPRSSRSSKPFVSKGKPFGENFQGSWTPLNSSPSLLFLGTKNVTKGGWRGRIREDNPKGKQLYHLWLLPRPQNHFTIYYSLSLNSDKSMKDENSTRDYSCSLERLPLTDWVGFRRPSEY